MKHVSIRFLIGLSAEEDESRAVTALRADQRAALALDVLSENYLSLASHRGIGYWEGDAEPTLIAEAIMHDTYEIRAGARQVAARIARELGQSCVGLAFAPVELELVEGGS